MSLESDLLEATKKVDRAKPGLLRLHGLLGCDEQWLVLPYIHLILEHLVVHVLGRKAFLDWRAQVKDDLLRFFHARPGIRILRSE